MLVTKGEQGERTPTTVREPCSAKLHEHTDNRFCCDCPQRRWCNVFLFCCCTQAILIFLLVEELKNFIARAYLTCSTTFFINDVEKDLRR